MRRQMTRRLTEGAVRGIERIRNTNAFNHREHRDHGDNSIQIRNRLIPSASCRTLKLSRMTPIGKSEPGSIVRRAPPNSGSFLGLFPSVFLFHGCPSPCLAFSTFLDQPLVGIAATPRVVSRHHAPSRPRPRARHECMDLAPDAEERRCCTRCLPPAPP